MVKKSGQNIKNTMLYTYLLPNEENEEYISKIARTIEDARQFVEVGFEYVCEIEDAKLQKTQIALLSWAYSI